MGQGTMRTNERYTRGYTEATKILKQRVQEHYYMKR